MTSRERFLKTLCGGTPDRVPLWEEGLREDVRECWAQQGFPATVDLHERFGLDRRELADVNLYNVTFPLAEIRDQSSRLEELRRQHDPLDPARYPADWTEQVAQWQDRSTPLGLMVSRGLLLTLGVGDWNGLQGVLYALHDHPNLIAASLDSLADFSVAMIHHVCSQVRLDYALFSEPIASNHNPVVSPTHYRRFCLPAYRRIVEALRQHGVQVLIWQTWGHLEPFLKMVLELGPDVLWCGDTQPGHMDYLRLRQEYGRDLGLIGGIDVHVLACSRPEIEAEVYRVVLPLLESGRYLPLADGRVRAEVPWAHYEFYREILARIVKP